MTITCLCHVRMTTAMVKTRAKVVETTGLQVVITGAGKEMTVLTIINNLRKICASLFTTNNLQENHVAWRQNDREKSRNNTDGQQNHRNNDRDNQSVMWSCPLHLIITIGDGGGSIRYKRKEQRKARRSGDDRWEMAQGRRRSTKGYRQER